MHYSELNIATQRQSPARARNEGEAILKRAGYVDHEGKLSSLGRRAVERLRAFAELKSPAEFFGLLELPCIASETGDWFFPSEAGRVQVLRCPTCGYASARDLARFQRPQPHPGPALPLEKVETPEANTIEALARYLSVPTSQTAKALMYTRIPDHSFVFVVIRGDMQLSEAKLRSQVGEFRAATTEEVMAAGATPGYASPIGLKGGAIVVDELVPHCPNLVAGANESGFHFRNTNYGRDYRAEIVADVALATPGSACPNCGEGLAGIAAEPLADTSGYSYEQILEAVAATHRDEKGLTLPNGAAPFDVYLLHLAGKELDTRGQAARLDEAWTAAGLSVLFDDRDERAGVKFADADLIGLPIRATVGERGMKDGMVELKPRSRTENVIVPFAEALNYIKTLTKTAQ